MGVLKIHNSGLVTSTTNTNAVNKIHVQTQPATQTIANAQVCLDSMAISDVDVRTNHIYFLINILLFHCYCYCCSYCCCFSCYYFLIYLFFVVIINILYLCVLPTHPVDHFICHQFQLALHYTITFDETSDEDLSL